ncbi:hypothetical protein QYM36_018561, partial [Artemia franciscana]
MSWFKIISFGVIGTTTAFIGMLVKWRIESHREYEKGISLRGVKSIEYIKGLTYHPRKNSEINPLNEAQNADAPTSKKHVEIKKEIEVDVCIVTDKNEDNDTFSKICGSIIPAEEETIEAEDCRDVRLSSANVDSDKQEVFINCIEKTIIVEVESNASINNVKLKIELQLGIPKDDILLVFDGKQLDNDEKISDSNCRDILLIDTTCFHTPYYDILCYNYFDDIITSYKNNKQLWHRHMKIADSTKADCIITEHGEVFLRKGDLIEFDHYLNYSEWVIYIGNMQVVYVNSSKNDTVMIGNVQEVRGNRRWRINNSLDDVFPAFHEDQIVTRAKKKLDVKNPNLRSFNTLELNNPLMAILTSLDLDHFNASREKHYGGIASGFKVIQKNGITVDCRLSNLILCPDSGGASHSNLKRRLREGYAIQS